ncbi:hypothetical protein T4D_1000 [Trichinella pseudospiralis]|uniref:Uncharacterized protein n=1 Tax=Trichinella pseudospiralis TaxID=6337 RepID=A0A0V1G286_TRIPS|nr:hypothetical protein T4D_1000 [Trichinella pseudospiralis]
MVEIHMTWLFHRSALPVLHELLGRQWNGGGMRVDELWEGIRTWKCHLRNLFPAKLFCYGIREPAGHFCVVFRSNLGPSPQGYINSVVAE